MDKLEQYLDQVCRCIGWPRALRQHVRQELREHLLDAAAEHQAAGLSAEAARDKALEEFGKPEEVRSELEAAHGQRMLAVVIDKAMQWKERTMKAKWLWTSWAYLGLALVIALEVMFITFAVLFLVPKFFKLMADGIIDPAIINEQGVSWMPSFLRSVGDVGDYTLWLVLFTVVVWGLFEWRVRSENKSFMRMSALGTVAVGLMVVVMLMAGSLVIPYMLTAPATRQLAQPFALEQADKIDTAVIALEQALAKKDWEAMAEPADRLKKALDKLSSTALVLPALTSFQGSMGAEELRKHLNASIVYFVEAQQAIRYRDAARLEPKLQQFRKAFAPVQEAAKRPAR
jgi:hypothetical protein